MRIGAAFIGLLACSLVACGGGGGGGTPPLTSVGAGAGTPTPVPSPSMSIVAASLSTSKTTTVVMPAIAAGYSATIVMPPVTSVSTATLTLQSAAPTGVVQPQVHSIKGRQIVGGTNLNTLAYVTLRVNPSVAANATPAFTFTMPAALSGSYAYVALYDENNAAAGWTAVLGPGTVTGNSVSFSSASISPAWTIQSNDTYVFALVVSGSLITPAPSPTSGATPGPNGAVLTGPSYGSCNVRNCLGGYGPLAIANAFQFPVQSGYNGRGQTVAIVIDDVPSTTDLNAYLSYFQIPNTGRTIGSVAVDGGGSNAASAPEATLDAETIAGLAPGANIVIYNIPSLTTQYTTDAYNQILTDGLANIANSSFGGCEYANMTAEDTVLAQGAAAGVAFTASSGDQGDECYNGTGYSIGVGYPASDPNVIGVGGTETEPSSVSPYYDAANPVAWNDSSCSSAQCATGGGVSANWAIPTYQTGLAGTASQTHRNVPDVAMPAEYAAVYTAGSWGVMAGTSWSSPIMAALMSEIYEYCGGAPFTNPVTKLYSAYGAAPSAFLDVTSGNNRFGTDATYYAAALGYDNVAGVGAPYGMPLAAAICPSRMNPGLNRRNGATIAASAIRAAAVARTVNVTPRVLGLSAIGRRDAGSSTRVQLVLRPTSTMASDEAAVVATLKNSGFSIERTFSNHLVIDANAPNSIVESMFSTQLENVAQTGAGTRYMPASQAVIPASLTPYVAAISLDNVVLFHSEPHSRRL